MVLRVDGIVAPSCALDALLASPVLAAANEAFLSQSRSIIPRSTPALCLLQGEAALLAPAPLRPPQHAHHPPAQQQPQAADGVTSGVTSGWLLGSQDATTCAVAVLHCPATGTAWAAHMDTSPTAADEVAIAHALSHMQKPRLFLAGAYVSVKNHHSHSNGPLLAFALVHAACGPPASHPPPPLPCTLVARRRATTA